MKELDALLAFGQLLLAFTAAFGRIDCAVVFRAEATLQFLATVVPLDEP
jgi:hypothetical protein